MNENGPSPLTDSAGPTERADVGYQTVTCAGCDRSYTCTPLDDYYDFTTVTDGCCFSCLCSAYSYDDGTAEDEDDLIIQALLDAEQ